MLLPGVGTLVLWAMVTDMSAFPEVNDSVIVDAVAWLFAGLLSGVLLETVFVPVMTYPGPVPVVFTTIEKFAVAPEARVGVVQVMIPVAFTAGVMQVQPGGR